MSEQEKGVSLLDTPYAKSFIQKLQNHKKEDGNLFELFTSMQDVDIFLKWIEPSSTPEFMEAMKLVLGVADQEGQSMYVEGIGEIDISIAPFIEELNKKGVVTLASCSGLLKEHPTKTDRISGYLSFLYQEEVFQKIKVICEELNLPLNEGKCYFKPAFTVRFRGETDKEIERKWLDFQSKLLQEKGRE